MTQHINNEASFLVFEIERRAYPLTDAPFIIGRDAGSGIVIREPAVSRSHAEIRPEGDEFVLTSTGATGTRLNAVAVTTPQKLKDGDRIEIGSVAITFKQGRLPLGVSVVDTASPLGHDPDAMTRRSTISNPILGNSQSASPGKKPPFATFILLVILIGVAAWYFLSF